jgi:alkylation response protein AidB-like acyl-CoA dehydrogenase
MTSTIPLVSSQANSVGSDIRESAPFSSASSTSESSSASSTSTSSSPSSSLSVNSSSRSSTLDEVRARFRPLFERIGAGAVARETQRILPFEEVKELKDAGFGALRVPVRFGGDGLGLVDFFRLLIELGEADSNLPQLLRGHIAFVETQIAQPESTHRSGWLRRIARREILFGNAQAERSDSSTPTTRLTEEDGRLLLNGRKYYSTGTLFADWIWSGAAYGDTFTALAVPVTATGVTRVDDWDGFGQRLTGSGTTIFENVEIDPAHVLPWDDNAEARSLAYSQALYQLILLASLAGIGRAVLRDAVAFVKPRTRTFGVPGKSSPRTDPLVQRVVGRIASLRFATEATVLEAVNRLETADRDGVDADGVPLGAGGDDSVHLATASARGDVDVPGGSSRREVPGSQEATVSADAVAPEEAAAPAEASASLDAAARPDEERYFVALTAVFEAQQVVIDLTLQATTLLFEVGGASAVSTDLQLDRLWRNARTISSHNPAIYREQAIGDFYLNDALPKSQLQLARESKLAAPGAPEQ